MKRGDVVAFDYPFSDGSGSKIRPSLVVQSDALKSQDTILAMIGSTARHTSAAIDPVSEPKSGVKKPCYVRCEKLFSVDRSKIIGSVGRVSQSTLRQVEESFRKVFEL